MKLISSILIVLLSSPAHAFEWSDLWLNDHQKAQKLLKENPAAAADTFPEPEWQGVAKYNAGDFSAAAEKFNKIDNSASEYNLGNALAKAGELEKALESYEDLLEQPSLPSKLREDATFNRDLVKKLLEQQESQQSEDKSENQTESESGEDQESQDSDQQGQQGQDQSDAEQSESEQSEGESSDENQNQQASAQDEEQKPDSQETESHDEKSQQEEKAESANQQAQSNQDEPMTEDQQATEQWLRQIPDDPSGLLRRKLIQSHRTKYPQVQNGGQAW